MGGGGVLLSGEGGDTSVRCGFARAVAVRRAEFEQGTVGLGGFALPPLTCRVPPPDH